MYSIFYTTETMHGFFPVFQKFIFRSCTVSVVWISVVENTVLVELKKTECQFLSHKGWGARKWYFESAKKILEKSNIAPPRYGV